MTDVASVQNLITGWWFDYDQGNYAAWPAYFTADARFTCQSDSGKTDFEEFVTADVSGREALLAWQEDHRRNSPYPLRHNGTNIHVASSNGNETTFRSYIFVTQIVDGAVSNLSSGLCIGKVREEDGSLRIAELRIILDFTDSELFDKAERVQPA